MPKDQVLYTVSDGSVTFLKSIKPDGTADVALASFLATDIKAVAPNPTVTNKFAFASLDSVNVTARLYYGNAALNPGTSTLLTPTVFADIDDVQFSPDGTTILFKADTGNGYKLYAIPVTGGSEVVLDDVFEFHVNPVVGTKLVAYSKPLASTSEVYKLDYTTGVPVPVTALGSDVFFPTWSRDGQTILFSYASSVLTNQDLYSVGVNGGTVTQVTNTPTIVETFGFFNHDKSKIAAIMFDGLGNLNLEVMDGNGTNANTIVTNNSLGIICYWTDLDGRKISMNLPHYQIGKRKSRR